MNQTVYRIIPARLAESAFDGEGSLRYGGRWNHKGIPIVYTSSSPSLAALEIMVHLEDAETLEQYVIYPVEINIQLIQTLDISDLPEKWDQEDEQTSSKNIGSEWAQEHASVGLIVPSVLVPIETNILLNPQHPDFSTIIIRDPISMNLDLRLFVQQNSTDK